MRETLIVEEKKVVLNFSLMAKKLPFSFLEPYTRKNKTTLLSPTLKVEEKSRGLLFSFTSISAH